MSSDSQAPAQEAANSETEVDTTSQAAPAAKRRGFADTVNETFTLLIFIGVAAAGIVATLSGHSNFFVGSDGAWNILIPVFTILATAALLAYVAFRYNPADSIRRHLRILAVAVGVNAFLAISVWIIIVNFIHPAVSPHRAGLMVWWNLSDAIPIINVNSVLDWQQPLTGYSVKVGWLFLLQRVVIILTLIRVIQVLFARWTHHSRAETTTATTGSEDAGLPTDHSGN